MQPDLTTLALIAAIFTVAGWIKGVIGLGLPTIATGLMGLFMLPAQAAAIVVVPALLTNIWQMLSGIWLRTLIVRLWPLLVCIIGGTVATAGMITRGNVRITVAMLGLALMAYAIYALAATRFTVSRRAEPAVGALAGLATGIICGTTGVFVVPGLPFLQAIDLGKDEMIQAIGLMAFTGALGLALGLGVHGGLGGEVVVPASVATAAGLAGMGLGQVLRSGLSLETFRRLVLLGLLGLGAIMALRAFA